MMINCPKCNLLQPQDHYCVQCGIDLKNWDPKKRPIWKEVTGHWVFQVAILFSVIFLVVLQDSFKDQTNRDEMEPTALARKQSGSRTKNRNFSDFSKEAPGINPKESEKSIEPQAPQPLPEDSVHFQTEKQKTMITADETITKTLNKKTSFRAALINRRAIEELIIKGQRLEENALIIGTRSLRQITNQPTAETKTMGQTLKTYQFNQEIPLFIGEEDLDTNFNLGFYLQVTVFEESRPEGIRFGAKTWYQLKTNGESSSRREWEGTISASSSLVILNPEAHDIAFTREEMQLFESSRSLKPLGDENFQDEISDIILVVEIR